ncbi:hypothetical protein HDU67_005647 [Dinochytrium kinnereticum]|nr:hypothetical protein HDU67_005647 [Dinochytrium kinnereticum]
MLPRLSSPFSYITTHFLPITLALLAVLILPILSFIPFALPPSTEYAVLWDLVCINVPLIPTNWVKDYLGCEITRLEVVREKIEIEEMGVGASKGVVSGCVFCEIADGSSTSARVVYRDEEVVAFKDINPSARVHLLVVPVKHVDNVLNLTHHDIPLLNRMREIGVQLLSQDPRFQPPAASQDVESLHPMMRVGFHVPPFTSVPHLHLHAIGLPFHNWVRAVKYPSDMPAKRRVKSIFPRVMRWFVSVETLVQSLQDARDRDDSRTWRWEFV